LFNPLPAVLIGGPPHAGKSVLTYSLTQALRKRHREHYVIRACPDGEGDWSQEIDRETARLIRIKGQWRPEFVRSVCYALKHRQFPLLVDMGGRPEEWQREILASCTHSLLLLRPDNEASSLFWQRLVQENDLIPLARLTSLQEGVSTITTFAPVLEGTVVGLHRQSLVRGPLFDALVERIDALFTTSSEELRQSHFDAAPAQVVDLDALLQKYAPRSERWEPQMLPSLLAGLPRATPLAIYGRGTNWLYAALVEHVSPHPFYQFDPRLGWVTPPQLQLGSVPSTQALSIELRQYTDMTLLSARLLNNYLDYAEGNDLVVPTLSSEAGVILSGKLPFWLVTALVHLYNTVVGVPWIACYSPQLQQAVVVASRVETPAPGSLIAPQLFEGDIEGV
jgi:CRISPR-associated protein Csx3